MARVEFADYQLVQADPTHFHGRNLRVDDQVFHMGSGVDRAGVLPTNFGPAENSVDANTQLDNILALGTVIHRS